MNESVKILGIAGSLRRQSYNRSALRAAQQLVPEGATLDIFELATAAERYTLTAKNLTDRVIQLNGNELKLEPNDALPELKGTPTKPGPITFAPASITFLAVAEAHNSGSR